MTDNTAVVAAFSAEQVARITGLSMRQLVHWDGTGFFAPQYASASRRSPYSRIYSFPDLVGLRTISVLLNGHNVTMRHLKEVAERLSKHITRPWSEIKFMVWKRKVQWIEPDTGLPAGVVDGQYVMIELIDIIEDMRGEVERTKQRDASEIGQITRRRYVSHNLPVVAGTRIPVRAVKRFSESGYSVEKIIAEYPTLTKEDVAAALAYISISAAA